MILVADVRDRKFIEDSGPAIYGGVPGGFMQRRWKMTTLYKGWQSYKAERSSDEVGSLSELLHYSFALLFCSFQRAS